MFIIYSPVIRKLINKVDYNALDVKMEKSKVLITSLKFLVLHGQVPYFFYQYKKINFRNICPPVIVSIF
jgi:hypothetical protein